MRAPKQVQGSMDGPGAGRLHRPRIALAFRSLVRGDDQGGTIEMCESSKADPYCVAAPFRSTRMMRLVLLWWISRSEEHTSELQSLMRISYAVFCLKKKKKSDITLQHSKAKSHIDQT